MEAAGTVPTAFQKLPHDMMEDYLGGRGLGVRLLWERLQACVCTGCALGTCALGTDPVCALGTCVHWGRTLMHRTLFI